MSAVVVLSVALVLCVAILVYVAVRYEIRKGALDLLGMTLLEDGREHMYVSDQTALHYYEKRYDVQVSVEEDGFFFITLIAPNGGSSWLS